MMPLLREIEGAAASLAQRTRRTSGVVHNWRAVLEELHLQTAVHFCHGRNDSHAYNAPSLSRAATSSVACSSWSESPDNSLAPAFCGIVSTSP